MLSYLYVLKVSAVCGLAPLAFLSVTAWGGCWRGSAPPYLQLAFLCQYIYIIFSVHVNFHNFVISFTLHVL